MIKWIKENIILVSVIIISLLYNSAGYYWWTQRQSGEIGGEIGFTYLEIYALQYLYLPTTGLIFSLALLSGVKYGKILFILWLTVFAYLLKFSGLWSFMPWGFIITGGIAATGTILIVNFFNEYGLKKFKTYTISFMTGCLANIIYILVVYTIYGNWRDLVEHAPIHVFILQIGIGTVVNYNIKIEEKALLPTTYMRNTR